MPYIPPEVVEKAREMDLLTFLKTYEPQELVHFGGNTYCTREHDSLKISNGKWRWFSRGIGGYSALDYLIKVKEMPFLQAVETIMGNLSAAPPTFAPTMTAPKEKVLLLPQTNRNAANAIEYLRRRGIDRALIDFRISTGRLYESYPYHNTVFVGQDRNGKPRYANLRGIGSDFIGDANGSDKHYSFGIPAAVRSDTPNLFDEQVCTNYASNYERYIRPGIGFIKLSDINTTHIQKLLNTLHERGYMYKTVLQVRIILVDMFEKAIASEYMTKIPQRVHA